ncbi:MAG TPA: DNA-3-methyladenine glycosylase [Gemmatimonadales bacterium]|nr:DNA-3-methyladenine glycosylase [Gemmatimonadales bacterium]
MSPGARARAGRLAFDPEEAVRHLGTRDARLRRLIARVGGFTLRPEPTQSLFQALARSIVYQQLAGRAAATIHGRVQALFPDGRLEPAALLALPDESLRGAGLSAAKLAALQDLARKTLDGTVPTMPRLRRLDDEEIIERLTTVRGIGRWTVEMLLMFRLGRPDVLPLGDLGVRKGFQLTYGLDELPTPDELRERAERWRPYRSVGSWYMWRATEL